MKKLFLLLSVTTATLWGLAVSSSPAFASNSWDFYRWPWRYQETWTMTQGWDGATSHHGTLFRYAIDVDKDTTSRPVFAADEGSATCGWDYTANLGYAVRVTHGSDSSLYGHFPQCYFAGPVAVVQGFQIGWSGRTGGATAIHLHFQVNTTATGFTSKSFSISGYTNFSHGGADCPPPPGGCPQYTSDNDAAGYDTSLNYYSAIHDHYVSDGGWAVIGASDTQPPGWSVCGVNTAAVYGCSESGYSGVVQTFVGTSGGAYAGYHAVLKGNAYSGAATMTRGIWGGFSDKWDGVHDGLWYLGYPSGNSYPIGGYNYRMNFQNGYATYNSTSCASYFYYGPTYTMGHTAYYCD